MKTLGTLSDLDDNGSENVAKKMNLRSFKLNRVFLDPVKDFKIQRRGRQREPQKHNRFN